MIKDPMAIEKMDCPGKGLSILVVDDDPVALKNLQRILRNEGYEIIATGSGEEAIRLLNSQQFHLVLADLVLDRVDGLDVLAAAKKSSRETEVIILTGHGSIGSAIEAMRMGAFHYLEKPISIDLLRHTISQAVIKLDLVSRVKNLECLVAPDFPAIMGNSPRMVELKKLIRQIQDSDSNILITGETGTGKELVARAIHQSSRRKSRRFLAINCASFTEELLANELFGHEKEAYTGATGHREGLLESAAGGTLFLDEVGDMTLTMQAKILRVIQEREFIRVGGTEAIPVDIRIISATNRCLKKLISAGCFRQDLFFRLNVIGIQVPNLVERREDIPLLAANFLKRFSSKSGKVIRGISREAMHLLQRYGYPGNVRELENIVEHATSMARGDLIQVDDLPQDLTGFDSYTFHQPDSRLKTLKEVETDYISWVLEKVGNKKTEAAKILGIDRASLYRKMKRRDLGE